MNYWLHRISHSSHVSYPLLEKGYLSIGFSDFAEKDFIDKMSNSPDWDYLESTCDKMWDCRPRIRYSLWRFVAEMTQGDWVIVPSYGVFSIYEIEEHYAVLSWGILEDEDLDKDADIGFLRKVRPIAKNISRYDYADAALTSRMKHRDINANISDLEQSIKKAYEAYKATKPLNLKSRLYEISIKQWQNEILSGLNPDKFENLVQNYFRRVNATEVYFPSKNEANKSGDADVIATFEPIKTIIHVQAKHHRDETSDWAVQQIKDFADSKKNLEDGYNMQYWVVSSSDSFSEEGKKLAREEGILLITGPEFVQMLMDAGIQNVDV